MKTFFLLLTFLIPFLYSSANADEWKLCANENGYCNFLGKKKVRYGSGSKWHYLTLNNGTACNNSVFGDPALGSRKRCYYYIVTNYNWTSCAKEGGYCRFVGRKTVQYGVNGRYSYKTLEDGAYCNNYVFGDPAPGLRKNCSIKVYH